VSVGLTHPGDERTFFTTPGHVAHLSWPQVRDQLEGFADGVLLLCASFLTDSLTADYPALFDWAARHSVHLALDTGWPVAGWTDEEKVRARGWLAHTRHLLVNEIEAKALSGTDRIDAALPRLLAMMPTGAVAVVKAGAEGAFASCGQGSIHVAPPRVAVIDTIGAGDVFNAGYLLAVAQGADLHAAVMAGVALASRAISTSPRIYEMADIYEGVA
jgi:sugar/nucleoside kinase (ribokinase family)